MSRSANPLPKNWPPTLRYLPRPLASPSLPRSFPLPPSHPPSTAVRIRLITSPGHPACGQHGLFAARTIKPKERILPYHGVYHTAAESDPGSDYDLWVEREWVDPLPSSSDPNAGNSGEERSGIGIGVDAAKAGNEARFVNDYRGVADRANAEFVVEDGRMWVVALERGVKKGEEVLVSYGKGFWEGRRAEMDAAASGGSGNSHSESKKNPQQEKKNQKKIDTKSKKSKNKGSIG